MEASLANRVQFGSRMVSRNPVGVPTRRRWAAVSFRSRRFRESRPSLEVSCSYEGVRVSTLETGRCFGSFDEALALQTKSQEIEPYSSGRCIYLVGLMGSGKTTVGKIIAQVLNYSFSDSDKLIEQSVNGVSVSEIFKLYGEPFFREKETEALKKLSVMQRVVVSTGGGAVVRPVNWRYMQKGISVWLDVPLEALAKRIAAEGTESRPILHQEPGDPYTKALKRLSTLLEERYDCYANADARVSLENIAAKQGYRDVSSIPPTAIALEALELIGHYLREDDMLGL